MRRTSPGGGRLCRDAPEPPLSSAPEEENSPSAKPALLVVAVLSSRGRETEVEEGRRGCGSGGWCEMCWRCWRRGERAADSGGFGFENARGRFGEGGRDGGGESSKTGAFVVAPTPFSPAPSSAEGRRPKDCVERDDPTRGR